MGSSSGPRNSSKDGLVFALDAADTNTITRWSTFKNMSTWSAGSGGASGYSQNGGTDENERVEGTDPWGNPALVWESRANGNGNDDGGWNADYFNIDNTKLYRFAIWVKRTSSSGGGTFYFGTNGGGQCVRRLSDGGLECNPYWNCTGTSGLTQNQWYLVIGHCFPYTYASSDGHPDTGFWTIDNGGQKVGAINGCNIGNDCKSDSATTSLNHRTYHYYCGDSTTRLQWYDPRVDLVDGTEPKVRELLKGPVHGTRSPFGGPNFGRLANGAGYTRDKSGGITFDGTDDCINLNSSTIISGNNPFTIEAYYKMTGQGGGALFVNYGPSYTSNHVWFSAMYGIYIAGGIYVPNYPLANGTYHLAATRESNGATKVYLNGVLVNSGTLTTSVNTNINYRIGTDVNGSAEPFAGTLYNLNVYNRVLSADNIAKNYANYKTRFNLP